MEQEYNNIDNREFEVSLPPGHKERFIAKLDAGMHKGQAKILRFQAMTLAASIALVVTLSIVFMLRMNQFNQQKALLVNVSSEMYETELFYQQSIETGLNSLAVKINDSENLLADLNEMDESLKKVNQDLIKNPGDERIIEAILIIYQTKLDLITDVLNRIQ